MRTKNEWSDWNSINEWEEFVRACNKAARPARTFRQIAIRNLVVGFILGTLVWSLWLR